MISKISSSAKVVKFPVITKDSLKNRVFKIVMDNKSRIAVRLLFVDNKIVHPSRSAGLPEERTAGKSQLQICRFWVRGGTFACQADS